MGLILLLDAGFTRECAWNGSGISCADNTGSRAICLLWPPVRGPGTRRWRRLLGSESIRAEEVDHLRLCPVLCEHTRDGAIYMKDKVIWGLVVWHNRLSLCLHCQHSMGVLVPLLAALPSIQLHAKAPWKATEHDQSACAPSTPVGDLGEVCLLLLVCPDLAIRAIWRMSLFQCRFQVSKLVNHFFFFFFLRNCLDSQVWRLTSQSPWGPSWRVSAWFRTSCGERMSMIELTWTLKLFLRWWTHTRVTTLGHLWGQKAYVSNVADTLKPHSAPLLGSQILALFQ